MSFICLNTVLFPDSPAPTLFDETAGHSKGSPLTEQKKFHLLAFLLSLGGELLVHPVVVGVRAASTPHGLVTVSIHVGGCVGA